MIIKKKPAVTQMLLPCCVKPENRVLSLRYDSKRRIYDKPWAQN